MRKWLFILLGAGLAIQAVLVIGARRDPLHTAARREWKQQHLAELAARVAEASWPSNELARMESGQEEDRWLSKRIIRMESGEWLAYASVCAKEPAGIADLFVARGSDGKWYYSTFHFCIGMLNLKIEDQPKNLAEFTSNYCLREFDGQSEVCLEKTYPRRASSP